MSTRKEPEEVHLRLGISPHGGTEALPGGQRRLIDLALSHFVTMCIVGRSWGKTLAVLMLLWYEMVAHKGHYSAAYCAPTYRVAEPVYRACKSIFAPFVTRASDVQLTLEFKLPGRAKAGTWRFWSLEKYDNLRFFRLNRAVIDEGSDVHEDAVFRVVVPMFLARDGRLLVIGTPKRTGIGAGWMHRLWARCMDPDVKDHAGMQGPSHGNPKLKAKELARQIELVSAKGGDKAVREEIYAEWLEEDGSVFTNLVKAFSVPVLREEIKGRLWIGEDPDEGLQPSDGSRGRLKDWYVMGLDFGRAQDYTVAAVFNERTGMAAALYRIHLRGAPYHKILPQLHALRTRYNDATVYYDATGGHGGAVSEWMGEHYGDGCIGRTWTTQGREADISRAQRLCERAGSDPAVVGPSWGLLQVPWLRAEFEAYQAEARDRAGRQLRSVRYGAPPGEYDDGVAACCLASYALSQTYMERPHPEPAPAHGTDAWWAEKIDRDAELAQFGY